MTTLPRQPAFDYPSSQQVDFSTLLDFPSSTSTAGPSSAAYTSHHPANGLPPTPVSSSAIHTVPGSHPLVQSNSQGQQWWDGSGSGTPPSAHGSHSTPPRQHEISRHPQFSQPQSGDVYTPMYSQLVTPSTIPYESNMPPTRPPLASSLSYPGPMFPSGSHPTPLETPGYHMPVLNVNGMDGGYEHGPSQSYHFGMPPPPVPHMYPTGPHRPVYRSGPNGFAGNEEWVGEWEDDEHSGEFYHGNMEVSSASLLGPEAYISSWSPSLSPLGYCHPGSTPDLRAECEIVRTPLLAAEMVRDPQNSDKTVPDNCKIKHRRRTSPEQLKVLEHWFEINSKPDNALREWLASELGMTKRNVQVWFQNR